MNDLDGIRWREFHKYWFSFSSRTRLYLQLFLDISNHIIIIFQPTEFDYDNNQQFVFVYTLSSVL